MKYELVSKAINDADLRLRWSAFELAQALRQGSVSAVEITELYIGQIEKVEPHLNCVVDKRYDGARAEAAAADVKLKAARAKGTLDKLPPLLGVPFISKCVYAYPGLTYTCGIEGRRDVVADVKNPIVARLERSGAVLLVTGNVSEGCMWAESHNTVHGCSNNPYDLSRTPGGSSGGNGALCSALCGSFALTSDVAGSTRIPAVYNGLFGHKPSGGAIPNMRCVPEVHGYVERYCQLGPTSRSAKDLMPMMKLLAGPISTIEMKSLNPTDEEMKHHDTVSLYHRSFKWLDSNKVNVKKLRYFVLWDQPGAGLGVVSKRHPCMIDAQRRAVKAIEHNLRASVTPVSFKQLSRCFDIWSAMLQKANPIPFAEVISEGKSRISPAWESLVWLISWGKWSDHTLPALLLSLAENLANWTPKKNEEMIRLGKQLQNEINNLLGDDGVMICPSLPKPAPRHGPLPNLLFFADYAVCGIFNCMELPATAVPMGLSAREHLPVGIQLVAGNGNDDLTIAVANALEDWGEAKWCPPKLVHELG